MNGIQGTQIVDEWTIVFMEVLQLVDEQEIRERENITLQPLTFDH